MDMKVKLPSERAQSRIDKAKEIQGRVRGKDDKIRSAINWIAQKDEGKIFLRWLMQECGFNESKVTMTQGDISKDMTLYSAARESVYVSIRKHIDKENIIEVEL